MRHKYILGNSLEFNQRIRLDCLKDHLALMSDKELSKQYIKLFGSDRLADKSQVRKEMRLTYGTLRLIDKLRKKARNK